MFVRLLLQAVSYRFVLFVVVVAMFSNRLHAATLETCINAICIGEKAPTFNAVKKKFGSVKHAKIAGIDTNRTICLYDAAANSSIVLSFSDDSPVGKAPLNGIFVARGFLCQGNAPVNQKRIAGGFRSHRGIKLGMSKEKVIELLGSPSRVDDAVTREKKDSRYLDTRYGSKYGVTRLHYDAAEPSLLFNQFGIDASGQISSIWLNDSP